jgi:hypothetical protein
MLNDPVAAQRALLAMYAEDMFDPHPSHWNPTSAVLQAKGWNIVGYLTAANALLGAQKIQLGERVYYGFLAQSAARPSEFVAVIRGTEQFVEWLENCEGLLVPHPVKGKVEHGFFSIYDSMRYTKATAAAPNAGADPRAADGIAGALPAGATVTVIGHSLGAAMGTYLMVDAAVKIGGNAVSGSLFASPNTGDGEFVKYVDSKVATYSLYNYWADAVPRLPLRIPFDPMELGFQPLPKATWITKNNRQARIDSNLQCNHHAYCYAAMLDFTSIAGETIGICVTGKA